MQEASGEVWEESSPDMGLGCSRSQPRLASCVCEVQTVRREGWAQLSLPRAACPRDLLPPLPGQSGHRPAGLQPQRRGPLVASGSELPMSWRGQHRGWLGAQTAWVEACFGQSSHWPWMSHFTFYLKKSTSASSSSDTGSTHHEPGTVLGSPGGCSPLDSSPQHL